MKSKDKRSSDQGKVCPFSGDGSRHVQFGKDTSKSIWPETKLPSPISLIRNTGKATIPMSIYLSVSSQFILNLGRQKEILPIDLLSSQHY